MRRAVSHHRLALRVRLGDPAPALHPSPHGVTMLALHPVSHRWVPLSGPYFLDTSAATATVIIPGGVRVEATGPAARALVGPLGWTVAAIAAAAGFVGIRHLAKREAPGRKPRAKRAR